MDIDLIRLVAEDLHYLSTEWNQSIDDASLRRSSPALRSLLVEGQLGRAAHQVGCNLRIMAPATCKVMADSELREYRYYQAGGARYNGMMVQATSVVGRAKSMAEVRASYERMKDVMGRSYPVKLGTFLKQTSFVIDGVLISREEVIKYVANKLGGAHYDASRQQSSVRDISLEQKYSLLDRVRAGMLMAERNAVYYELLSIGQRLVNSRDVRNLRKQLSAYFFAGQSLDLRT